MLGLQELVASLVFRAPFHGARQRCWPGLSPRCLFTDAGVEEGETVVGHLRRPR